MVQFNAIYLYNCSYIKSLKGVALNPVDSCISTYWVYRPFCYASEALAQGMKPDLESVTDGVKVDLEEMVNSIFNRMENAFSKYSAWTALKDYLPVVLTGVAATSAVYYGVKYFYKQSEDQIGKPKVITEEKSYTLLSSATTAISNLFKVALSGVSAGVGAKALLSALDASSQYQNLEIIGRVSIGTGALVAGGVAYSIYKAYQSSIQEEPKPIFNAEITEVIRDITDGVSSVGSGKGYLQNVLFHGPEGTGKSMIAKVIAKNSNMNYLRISGGDLAQTIKRKEHVSELNHLMEKIKNSKTPTILFIDEAESFALDRDYVISPEHLELFSSFLSHIGEPSKKLMVVMATNRLEDIDPAVLNRMDYKIQIAAPENEERKQILEQYIGTFFDDKERKEFFNAEKVNEISLKIEGFSGRTIFKMLNAITGKKNATKDKLLTNSIIDKVVERFVEQEKIRTEVQPVAGVVNQQTSFLEKVQSLFKIVLNFKK